MTSREVAALIAYADSTGVAHRVTDINGPGHAPNSYHYSKGTNGTGLAVDFAGATIGVTPTTARQMADLWRAFLEVASQLTELIHAGPGITRAVKNGRIVDGLATYGPVTWPDHRDHVHVAVPRGVFLTPRPAAVAGTGPPTVTPHSYPGGEDMLIRHDVDVPALDGQGRGWVELDVPAERVVSIVVNGPYPPVDGYWELPAVARQDRGGKTIISITEGQPAEHLNLAVWSLG